MSPSDTGNEQGELQLQDFERATRAHALGVQRVHSVYILDPELSSLQVLHFMRPTDSALILCRRELPDLRVL